MPGLAPDLRQQLTACLCTCGAFNSNEELRALFIDARLYPWYSRVPEANTQEARVSLVLDTLHDQYNADGENALLLLLHALQDKVHPGTATYQELLVLISTLSVASPPAPAGLLKDTPACREARARYLGAILERYSVIETHAFSALAEDAQVGSPRRLPLLGDDGAYVSLAFDIIGAHREQEVLRNKRALEEVLALPGHLALIGDAGCGKTTVLQVILSQQAALAVEDLNMPLPVFLPLRLFEHACCDEKSGDYTHCSADLLRFIDTWFRAWCPQAELPKGFLERHIRAGRAWLLLDALDEVADIGHRETVRNIIQELASQLKPHSAVPYSDTPHLDARLIVTARVMAYRSTRLDDRFTVVTVRDLDDKQRARMVRAIYRGLALPDHAQRATELVARFEQSSALRSLGRTPVMVWTASVLHALRGELPESRAALYDAYIDILLKQSFKRTQHAVAALEPLADSEAWPLVDRRHYLTYAAFQVHALLEGQPERQNGAQVTVGEDELVDAVLAPYFAENLGDTRRAARARAHDFVTLMVERSGLLYENAQGYAFGDHLTMQEFLAGYYLAENYAYEDPKGYQVFLREKAGRTWWHEVVLLAAGYLGQQAGFRGRRFLLDLAKQGQTAESALNFLALSGRGLLQLRAARKPPTWTQTLAQDFANRLYGLLYTGDTVAPIPTRQQAALVLGQLYDLSTASTSLRDPRFPNSQSLPGFVKIPAGSFWMGSTEEEVAHWEKETGNDWFKRELPRHQVTLDAYQIAQYPTTNAMYAHFIADGGYVNPEWWEIAIADGYWKDGKVQNLGDDQWYDRPRYWDDARWNNPSQPVVGVNWYEAIAYCRWLTTSLNNGYTYHLPTEAEWERAARGSKGYRYPWGDEWAEDHCNSKETGLEGTSPVGLFPSGAAEGSVHDMVGNVYEWCRDWYMENTYVSPNVHNSRVAEKGAYRILRGGSWYEEGASICRCGYRGMNDPGYRRLHVGFRCVQYLFNP